MSLHSLIPLPLATILVAALMTGCSEEATTADSLASARGPDTTASAPTASSLTSELAYLEAYDGKYANTDGVFLTEPFNARLKALLGAWHTRFLGDLDVQGPVSARNGVVVISGCRAHHCNTNGSIVVVDLRANNIVAGYRIDNRISVYSEHPLDTAHYPSDLLHWAGDDPITTGSLSDAPKTAKSTGAFVWVDLEKASEGALSTLKKLRSDVRRSVLDELRADALSGCDVRITEYDLDGNGQSGILISRSGCTDWCGSAGCNISVYEGGRLRLSVNDDADQLKPGTNGVISSKGVLLKLE
jgi:hypothetical protein